MRQQIDPQYNYALSQVFGPTLVKRINDVAYEQDIKSLLVEAGLCSHAAPWDLASGLSEVYRYLQEYYRCEYVYKNEIANQLLLRFHSDNSATLLKEVRSGSSIADVVIINGNTVAYEIKTELDRFDRLAGQMESYQVLYDFLFIVTHEAAVRTVRSKVDAPIGIMVLDDRRQLITVRAAESTAHLFDPLRAIQTLRQVELVCAYEERVGKLPSMGTALIGEFCQKWYLSLEVDSAHTVFSRALKSRKPNSHQFSLVADCDASMKMLFLGRDLSKRYCTAARERLSIFG